MWSGLSLSRSVDTSFASSARELLQATSRSLIYVTGGAYLAWYFLCTEELERDALRFAPVTLVLLAGSGLALWLLGRRPMLAQVAWQSSLLVAITLAAYAARRAEVTFAYAVLPLLATVTISWPAGLAAEAIVTALVWWLARDASGLALPAGYGFAVAAGGAFTGLLGWAVTYALLVVTQWSVYSFEQAREQVEEARDQRLELKQTQEDLVQANRELARLSDRLKAMYQIAEEARQAKAEFVANVSHELRTPLNMIIGFSEMIPRLSRVYGARLPPALLSDIAAIHRNSQHLAKLVNDVLDLSQAEAGRMALSKEWTSLAGIVQEAVQVVKPLFDSKGLYLEADESELPPIFCDGTRVRQVVINLLSNAGRYTRRGGVRIKTWREEDDLLVSVSDTGTGIALEDRERIFEPFYQGDSTIRRPHGGSGLGLSISRQFVEMHGGKMWLESQVGVGTTFYFSLPLDVPLAALEDDGVMRWFSPYHPYEPRTRRSRAPAPTLVPRYVLLERGQALQRLFNHHVDDVELVPVPDMGQAIQALERSPAQALVVNAPWPEAMSGPLSQLGDLPYNTPAVTCWVPGEQEVERALGVVRYLVKPVTVDMLLAALDELGREVRTVLLVDDHAEALQLFGRMLALAERDYRVLQATNGQRALALLHERRPDVMLLDLIMPGMDGFQVLRAKAQDPAIRDIPVVVISSRDPSGEPIVSDTLVVTRSGGLSARALLTCIQAVSSALSPAAPPDDRGPPEKTAG